MARVVQVKAPASSPPAANTTGLTSMIASAAARSAA